MMHFHAVLLHIKGHIRHVKKVIGKILLDHVALVAATDDKVMNIVGRINFHDVP
ncbi:MAG: hypothetical protein ACD_39C01540G0001 [uncultured bacterium]|nr:MAG: hypothetical protein ACD_39C01540G0001 [uncultured bacterium]